MKKNSIYAYFSMSAILLISLSLLLVSCSHENSTDSKTEPEQILQAKNSIEDILSTEKTTENRQKNIDLLVTNFNKYAEADKEAYNVRDKNENFLEYNPGSDKCVLLLHGLGASPNEMRPLAEFLQGEGYTVLAVRMEGHGIGVDALEQSTWQGWQKSADFGLDVLDYLCEKVDIVGISTGASLGLIIAEHHELDGIVAVAPAIEMRDWKFRFISLFKHFMRYSERTLTEEEKATYDTALPTASIYQLSELIEQTKKSLPDVHQRLLIIQATDDPRLKKESAEYVLMNTGTPDDKKRMVWVEDNEHVILNSKSREKVFSEISLFLESD